MFVARQICIISIILSVLCDTSFALNCYQCNGSDSSTPFQCNEWLNSDIDILPLPCDGVYEAKYCIKHTGRFEGHCIKCFRCSSAINISCSDNIIHLEGQMPESCDDVYGALYCIKSISLNGGIGTKRYCSSSDLGNYCNYVKQPGDHLSYRTCIYTCTGDGCNSATITQFTFMLYFVLILSYFGFNFIMS